MERFFVLEVVYVQRYLKSGFMSNLVFPTQELKEDIKRLELFFWWNGTYFFQNEFLSYWWPNRLRKTLLLNKFDNSIDLEGYANHRGSAFGNNVTPQPKQIDFENHLIVD
jgi:hypothetical protein